MISLNSKKAFRAASAILVALTLSQTVLTVAATAALADEACYPADSAREQQRIIIAFTRILDQQVGLDLAPWLVVYGTHDRVHRQRCQCHGRAAPRQNLARAE